MTLLSGTDHEISVDDGVSIAATVFGDGPPVLLLHGYPQNRSMWHRVAPVIARHHTVVAADLRGYGDSSKPHGEMYDKRSMARDQTALMHALGFDRFAVVGHDRGARVAHRLALDEPGRVSAIAVLDIVPTLHMFDHVDRAMATTYFHWFFLARSDGLPERLIGAAPEAWLESRFAGRHTSQEAIDPRAYAEYRRSFLLPGTIAASCADYRAAATTDLDLDRHDHARGARLTAPTLALWGRHGYVGRNFDVPAVWADYAIDLRCREVDADHYLAEDAAEETAGALSTFLVEHRS